MSGYRPVDIWRCVSKVKVPTLVLYGQQSTTFLPSVMKKLRSSLPGASINGFANTGHSVPMERNNETVGAIFDFLKQNDTKYNDQFSDPKF